MTKFYFFPFSSCHDIHEVSTALLRVLPIYLVTYIPILLVMVVNPIIYYMSSKIFDEQLAVGQGQITQNERNLMKRFKLKFSFINLIFLICWIPNLISGILLWFFWYTLPVKLIITTWNCMAILNPLQAFFNTLVYRKWTKITVIERMKGIFKRKPRSDARRMNERSPLLRYEPTSLEGMETGVESISTGHSVNSCSLF